MCFFQKQKTPSLPALPSAPAGPVMPDNADKAGTVEGDQVSKAKEAEKSRLRQYSGLQSTILTSPLGLTDVANKKRTLLGS